MMRERLEGNKGGERVIEMKSHKSDISACLRGFMPTTMVRHIIQFLSLAVYVAL